MPIDNIDRDTMLRIRTNAMFLHEHETDIGDLKVQMDAAVTGLKARMQAMEDGGQSYLNEMGWPNMTPDEFFAIAYIVTAPVGDAVVNGRTELSAVRKMTP